MHTIPSSAMDTVVVPRLPQEVLDMIIDFLHDDEKALRKCSIIARAWVGPSRFHLFHHLYLRPRRLHEARDMLERCPEICVSVRTLRISEASLLEDLSTIDPFALLSVLNQLPNVHSVHVDKVSSSSVPRHARRGAPTAGCVPTQPPKWQHPFLRRLRATPRTHDVRELLMGLAFFSAVPVRELRLDDALWTSEPEWGSVQPPLAADYDALRGWRVGALVVPEHFPMYLAELVCYMCTVGIAETVVLLDETRNHKKLIAFLTKVGSAITSLEWSLDDPDGWSYWTRMTHMYWRPLASECTSLESIRFTIHRSCPRKGRAVIEDAIPQLNKTIRRVTIALHLFDDPQSSVDARQWLETWVTETHWGSARQMLGECCRLEYVAFVLAPEDCPGMDLRLAKWLRECLIRELPELYSMSKLRFGEVQ